MKTVKKLLRFVWNGMVHRSLKLEILGGISLIMFTSLTVVLNGVEGSKEIIAQSTKIKDVTFPALEESNSLIKIVEDSRGSLLEGIEDEDGDIIEELEEYKESFDLAIEKILERRNDTALTNIRDSYQKYYNHSIKVMNIVDSEGIGSVPAEMIQVNHANILDADLKKYRLRELNNFETELRGIKNQADTFSVVFLVSGLILMLVIIAITLRAENVFKSLRRLVEKGNNLADGDIYDKITTRRVDEIGELSEAFEKARRAILKAKEQ